MPHYPHQNMPDVVIPLIEWSTTDFAELRYALRGFDRYLPYRDIYIIGPAKPTWLRDAWYLPFTDDSNPEYREANIYLKLMYYVKLFPGSSFIYANDDHFLLKHFSPRYYHKGELIKTLHSKEQGDPYRRTINNTLAMFPGTYNYDIHYPCIMNAEGLKNLKADWTKKWGYCMKTLYVNYNKEEMGVDEKVVDFKINEPNGNLTVLDLAGLSYFSTSDKAMDENMIDLLAKLYPGKSRHEL